VSGAGPGPLNFAFFVAWTLAMLHRTPEMTLEIAIFTALVTGLPTVHLKAWSRSLVTNAQFLRHHGSLLGCGRRNSWVFVADIR